MGGPKLFVSYSWSSPDHEAWVLQLATELRESGIDVILDKWDLREGHDAHAFMEKMVTDREIKKVILVCDKAYVDKTDGRSGGVGTEAQIISGEIYAKQAQDKFVAIATERDETGRPYLPAYYRSRIYIDFSDDSKYPENFDRLLRWAHDQPLYRKPELGSKPSFLDEESSALLLGTSSRFKRAVDSVRNGRDYAHAAVVEYFQCLAGEIEKLRIKTDANPFDEAVYLSIEAFIPYRNEAIELFLTLAAYRDTPDMRSSIHRFFEQLIPYLNRPKQMDRWNERDFDNFRFIVHELFLYAIACLIKHERFDSAAYLMNSDYYVSNQSNIGEDVMVGFKVFHQGMNSLEERKIRLGLNRLSLRADLLRDRCTGVGIEFRNLMQADLILFMRDHQDKEDFFYWWPETLLYASHRSGPFEIFARSRSASYFDRTKVLLGVDSKEALQQLLESLAMGRSVPRWQHESFSPRHLLGFDQIATKA